MNMQHKSPLEPIVKHLAENKSMPALDAYIDSVESTHDDWGVFVNPDNPIHDYKIGYTQFHYGHYKLVGTLADIQTYPNGKAFCDSIINGLADLAA
jgi:hypothetical protein